MAGINTNDERKKGRFTADLRQRLRETAGRPGPRESDVIREAVLPEAANDLTHTAHDRAKRAGLVGLVKG